MGASEAPHHAPIARELQQGSVPTPQGTASETWLASDAGLSAAGSAPGISGCHLAPWETHTVQVSPRVRIAFREELVGWYLRSIDDLFQAEGFRPGAGNPAVSGERRSRVEQYYSAVDWNSPSETARILRVFEEVLARTESSESRQALISLLQRDGFEVDASGRIQQLGSETLAGLIERSDLPTGVRVQIDRIQKSLESDPEAAIGAAKELIEATTKHVLDLLEVDYGPSPKVPELVRLAQTELGVHPERVAPDRDGYDTIKVILGSLAQVAIRVNDLRRPYGTGHGRPQRPSGLRARHARLAAEAAAVYCRFTFQDPDAPWRAGH
jgi:hypothetical protein